MLHRKSYKLYGKVELRIPILEAMHIDGFLTYKKSFQNGKRIISGSLIFLLSYFAIVTIIENRERM